jgi:hypothetical protein
MAVGRSTFRDTPLLRSPHRALATTLLASVSALTLLASGIAAQAAAPLLSGGVNASAVATAMAAQQVGSQAAAAVAQQAQISMARAAQAIQAMQAAQSAARNLALAGPANLGADPNHSGQQLPNVPNGLLAGGLVASDDASRLHFFTEAARLEIVRLLPGYLVRSMQDYLTLLNSSNLPAIKPFLRVMILLGVSISFLVVLLTMHTMVLERTREIGILKSLGASRGEIARLFMAESTVMAALGVVIGLTATFATRAFLRAWAPGLAVLLTPYWLVASVGLAFLGALLGTLYPAWRASGIDPVEALAFE